MQFVAPSEQQTVTPTQSANTSNAASKSANGSGKVLQRVISITTANQSAKSVSKQSLAYVPEKLHFSAYEKFEGKLISSSCKIIDARLMCGATCKKYDFKPNYCLRLTLESYKSAIVIYFN